MKNPTSLSGGYRPDVDGLRAIAVTAVVLYHAGACQLKSGFTGVDIFFSISGYLIGGIIYSDVSAGRFSFGEFYARRARRIAPALLTVILATCAAGVFLQNSAELTSTSKQAIAALGGVSNILFWTDIGYFRDDSAFQPLLMTWSLGVEEQFYVLFPLLMLAASRLRRRFRIAALAAICVASLAISVYLTTRSNVSAFYLLPPRAWEMGAGVILAMAHRTRPELQAGRFAHSNALALVGLSLLTASVTLLKDQPFPGWVAIIPVLGTIILIHTGRSRVNGVVLGNRPLVYVGLISYSWYLWHWPMMAFVRMSSDIAVPFPVMLIVAAISFCIAMLSHQYIEKPFRVRGSSARKILPRYAVAIALATIPPAALIFTHGLSARLSPTIIATEAAKKEGRGAKCLLPFGQVNPRINADCTPASANTALLGDSHSAAISTGLTKAVAARGGALMQLSKSACAPLVGFTSVDDDHPNHADECAQFNAAALNQIVSDQSIRTVVVSGSWPRISDTRFRRHSRDGAAVSTKDAIEEGLTALIQKLHSAGKRVIVIGDVPRFDFDPMRHMTTSGIPARRWLSEATGTFAMTQDNRAKPSRELAGYEVTARIVRSVALAHAATLIDLRKQFCNGEGCAFARGNAPLFYDEHHLSAAGSREIDWSNL